MVECQAVTFVPYEASGGGLVESVSGSVCLRRFTNSELRLHSEHGGLQIEHIAGSLHDQAFKPMTVTQRHSQLFFASDHSCSIISLVVLIRMLRKLIIKKEMPS
jgi:hypothetical protein